GPAKAGPYACNLVVDDDRRRRTRRAALGSVDDVDDDGDVTERTDGRVRVGVRFRGCGGGTERLAGPVTIRDGCIQNAVGWIADGDDERHLRALGGRRV